jgi:type II secretory pathway component PulF
MLYFANPRPGVTSLFVEQAIKWKDRRWHLAAQICLTLTIFLAIFMAYFTLWYIVPIPDHLYKKFGVERPGFAQATIRVCDVAVRYRYLCLIAIAAAFGFFEWMCKSENKTSIRTFILVGLSLVCRRCVLGRWCDNELVRDVARFNGANGPLNITRD